ncbi:MAG: hypothetical protein RIS45_850 [Planctomycetota bacterium]|jgi:hypothetical protein
MTPRVSRILTLAAILTLGATALASQLLYRQAAEQRDQLLQLSRNGLELAGAATKSLNSCKERLGASNALAAAVEAVGAIPYRNPGANCYDHSKMLVKALAEAGVHSSIFVNATRKHAWVAAWIETTDGTFVSPTESATFPYGDLIEIRDPKLRVICSNE